jgi:hypothetical protein
MRFLKLNPVILAFLLSVIAEGLCLAAIFTLSASNVLNEFVRTFHLLPSLVYLFCPDVIDGYATERQEFIVTSICFTVAWLQWFFIFLIGTCLLRKYYANIGEQ